MMGGTKPRAQAPIVYYQPTPVYMPPVDPGPSEEEQAATTQKEKEKNLLRRARGTIGTVLNGFRGILSPSDSATPRKSLLGE